MNGQRDGRRERGKEERTEGEKVERKEKREREKERNRKMGPTVFQDSDLSGLEKILGIATNFREIFRTY